MNKLILAIFFIIPAFVSAQVDSIPPTVTGIYVNPNPVSPNNDGRNDSTRIGFILSEPSNVILEVVGTNPYYPGDSGYRLIDSTFILSGHYEYTWDGKIRGQIHNTTFSFMIFAVDTAGNMSDSTIFKVVVDTTLPTIPAVTVSPNPFSPNNDGIEDYANFEFTVGNTHPSEYDSLMLPNNRIATFIVTQSGYVLLQGNDTLKISGQIVKTPNFPPFPVYFAVKVDQMTVDGFSFGFKDWGERDVTVEVANRPIEFIRVGDLTNKMTASSLLSIWPSDSLQQATDYVQIGIYAFTGNASLKIIDEYGNTVITVNFWEAFMGDGYYLYQWGPGPIDDGRYTYDIQVEDEAGNIKHVGGEIIANSVPTTVGNIVAYPAKISPANQDGLFDVTEIRYSISEEAIVNIKLYNSTTQFDSTTYVATLLNDTLEAGGDHSIRFDGKINGQFLAINADSTYAVVVTVFDPNTGDADQGVGFIEIDNKGPSFVQLDTLSIPKITASPVDTIVGYTAPLSLVKIYKNGEFMGQVYSDSVSGRFEFQLGFEVGDSLIYAIAFDDVMNQGDTSNVVRFIYDPTPPVVVYTFPQNDSYINWSLDTLFAVIEDNISGVNPDTFSAFVEHNGSSLPMDTVFMKIDTLFLILENPLLPDSRMDGRYNFVIRVFDSAWNETKDTVRFTFDTEGPIVEVIPGDSSIVNSLDTVRIYVRDSLSGMNKDSTQVSMSGPFGNVSGGLLFVSDTEFNFYPDPPLPYDGSADGEYTFNVRVADLANNINSDTFHFIYDTQPPQVDTSFPFNGQILSSSEVDSILVVFSDNVSGVDMNTARATLFKDTLPVNGHYVYRLPDTLMFFPDQNELLGDGRYVLTLYVRDRAANILNDSIVFRIDTTPPQLLFSFPARDTALHDTLDTLYFYISDNNGCGVSEVHINLVAPDSSAVPGNMVNSGDTIFAFVPNSPLIPNGAMDGLYTVILDISDLINNRVVDTINFIYDNIPPYIISTRPDSGDTGVILRDSVYALISDRRPGVDTSSGIDFSRTHIFLLYPDSTAVPGRRSVHDNGDGTFTLSWIIDSAARIYSGDYILQIELTDRALNKTTKIVDFTVTAVEPVVMSVYPLPGAYVNSIDSVFALIYDRTGSGVDTSSTIRVVAPDGSYIAGTKSFSGNDTLKYIIFHFSTPLTTNGTYQIEITPISVNGITGHTFNSSFIFDNQAPLVVEEYPQGDLFTPVSSCWLRYQDLTGLDLASSSVLVTYGNDTISHTISQDGDTVFCDLPTTLTSIGQYVVHYRLVDLASNVVDDSFAFNISPPIIYSTEPGNNDTVRSQLSQVVVYLKPVTGSITSWYIRVFRGTMDTIPGDSVMLNDTTFAYTFTNPLATDGSDNGDYLIKFGVTLSNSIVFEGQSSFYYLCDNVPPEKPTLIDTLPERTTNDTITIRGLGEPGATAFLKVNSVLRDSQVVGGDSIFVFRNVSLGFGQNNFIDIFLKDEAGNVSDTLHLSIYCGNPIFEVIPSKPFSESSHQFLISLPFNGKVSLEIYTVRGDRLYRSEVYMQAGNYQHLNWSLRTKDGEPVSNGVYIYVIKVKYSNGTQSIKKGLLAVVR